MEADLVQFVRESLARGLPREGIHRELLAAGWPEDEVRESLESFAESDFPVPVPRRKPYLSAREAFLYLVLFLTLYISAISFGSLLFQFINRALPDAAISSYLVGASLAAIRWSTASILIAFPIFLLVSRMTLVAARRDPEKRGSRVRKWLTYLTLFVAAVVILCDLIYLVFNLLGGELTTRFILKALVVGGIAGVVYGYYLWDLRQDDKEAGDVRRAGGLGLRLFAGGVAAAVVLAVIAGLVQAGRPAAARSQRLDERRAQDLQQITQAIDAYWFRDEVLPASLEVLERQRDGWVPATRDPESQERYEYRLTGERSYELCAMFDAATGEAEPGEGSMVRSEFWRHGAGRACFPVEVDELP